jgi:uncharacterized protein (TIGR02421 family)
VIGPELLRRLAGDGDLRHALSRGGVLRRDRGLPFLLVHRTPDDRDDAGTDRLLSGESSFLLARAGEEAEVRDLVAALARAGSVACGAFLVLELWSSADPGARRITLHAPAPGPAPETLGSLAEGLRSVARLHPGVEAVVAHGDDRSPPGLGPLLTVEESWQNEVLLLGLELPAVYRDPATGAVFPRFLRRVQRELSRVLRRAIHEFVRVQTTAVVENHLALGTRTVADAVWEIDRELVSVERGFDLLLLTLPINGDEAWSAFEASGFDRNPTFHHRLLPIDPDLLKRRLFAVPTEDVDDPAIAELFQDKRGELDTLLTMLGERGTPAFRYSSQRLYGTVDATLLELARSILADVRPPGRWAGDWVDARGFRAAAEKELAGYRELHPELATGIQLRRDISGLMVSAGNLLIGEGLRLRDDRVLPLLHHEVGTHVLTYVNGAAQPLRQLALGLAGYDELQEGLAVLSEYLVGGLDPLRMRLLAARVVAAHGVEQGAEFVETFRTLSAEHGFSKAGAWDIATRVHASGGFTRDLIYLRGLVGLIELLRGGQPLEPLYVGKIARRHIPVIDELRHRGVLRDPPLRPRFLDDPTAQGRLEALLSGNLSLIEMTCPPNP